MLEFHELKIARNEIKSVKLSWFYDLPERTGFTVISNSRVERFVSANVHFRHDSEESREARLGIEIHCKNPVAVQRQILREMGGRRRLPRAPFEICDRDDLQAFACRPVREGRLDLRFVPYSPRPTTFEGR